MNIVRPAASVVLALHGAVHLLGFVVPWRIATIEGSAYKTTLLNGSLDVGDGGVRAVGIVWLVLALGFGVAAYATWRGVTWAVPLAALAAVVSLAICVLGLPEAAAGIAINVAILGAVAYRSTSTRKVAIR